MKTLQDIYTKLTLGTAPESEHTLAPAGAPRVTMATLQEIYDAIPANDKVCDGTNAGTATCITGTGTGNIATTDQIITDYYAYDANGAVVQGGASAGEPATEWASEDMPAEGEDGGYKTWTTGTAYCDTLDQGGHNDWRLPHLWELSKHQLEGNINPNLSNESYWSDMTNPQDSTSAYYVIINNGVVGNDGKEISNNLVRCVH
jgi:hypothetical protein